MPLPCIWSSTEITGSPFGRATPILTRGVSVLLQDKIHHKDDHDHEENTANVEDALSEGLGDNLSNILTDNPREPEPTTHSEIASMRKMMEEQPEMLHNGIQ